MNKKQLITILLSFHLQLIVFGQLQITPGLPAAALASSSFGNGITIVGEPVINCNVNQYGIFTNGLNTSLGFNSGLVMSTGTATLAAGTASSFASGVNNVTLTDPQLTAIAAGATNDVCIITITLVPQCNTLALRFVFGSEEYPEFVGGNFNDVFGFFVSGINPNGGVYDNLNVAQLPNGTPVSINNVNANLNNAFYVDNSGSTTIAYDGVTTVLTPVLDVIACQEYTFKLAIADAGDFSYDSAIFIDFISCATSVAAVDPVITPTTCGDATGGVDVSIVNGIGPFISSWVGIPGNFTDHVNNVSAGDYTISIFDTGMPCATASNFTFTVPNNGEPAATSINSPDSEICFGELVTLNATGADSFVWSDASGVEISNLATVSAAVNESQYIFAVGSTICSSDVDSILVQVNPTPVPAPTVSESNCIGDDVQMNANLDIPGTVVWIGPNNYFSTEMNPILSNATNATSGVYYVSGGVNGCFSGLVPLNVEITSPPTANPQTGGVVCQGQSLYLSGNSGMDEYQWSGPNGFVSNEQNPEISNANLVNAGEYSLTVSVNGCSSLANTTLAEITASPDVSILPIAPICEGEDITLSATSISSATYQWTGPNGFDSMDQNNVISNASLNESGTYGVIAIAGNCPSSMAEVNLVVNAIPQVTGSSNFSQGCEGDQISLSASDYPDVIYHWDGPNGYSSGQQNPIMNLATIMASGTYSVTATADGCVSPPSNVDVVIYPIPDFSLSSNSPVCAEEDLLLTSTIVASGDYNWTGPNGFNSIDENPVLSNVNIGSSGTYQLVISANGCVSSPQSLEVVVHPIPIANPINSGPVCEGGSLQLGTNTANGMTYQWQGPLGFTSNESAPVIATTQLNNAGTYQLVITQNGCSSQMSTTDVVVLQNPVVTASSAQDSICYGESVSLSVSGIVQAVWQPGQIQALNPVVTPLTSTNYSVVGIDANGCSGSDDIEITVVHPMLSAAASPESVVVPGSVEGYLPLPVVFNVNTNCTNFSWDFGDGSPSEMGTAVNNQHQHEYGNAGIYYAVVIGNLQGCGITDTIMVNAYGESAIGCPEGLVNCLEFQIPNIITPNGDDFNDFFWVPNVHLKELDVKIFNRWGVLVGQISEPNHYWDVPKAQWSGEGMDSGVYFYTISAQGKDRVNFQRQGNFQLVK